jgi:hypothetical protein
MLRKTYKEVNDGLGTVIIELQLPKNRLKQLQEKADADDRTVDMVIGDAINEYLVLSEAARRNKLAAFIAQLHQRIAELEEENNMLRLKLASMTAPQQKHCSRLRRF